MIYNHLINYPAPTSLNNFWGFGSLIGCFFITQIISGFFLTMHYIPNTLHAFNSVEYIMRDVQYGWYFRYVHSLGASFIFFGLYCHLFRNLMYNSFQHANRVVWYSGLSLLVLMMATAFLGYVLPWGQMSYWGATVITNMFTIIPYFGSIILEWLWGGYVVEGPTLQRFFSLHTILPGLMILLIVVHLMALHQQGSTNPLGLKRISDFIRFYPYFFLKDAQFLLCFLFIFHFILTYYPLCLNDTLNYKLIDTLKTPEHIVPEWYFLPFYGILRAIPHKGLGIAAMIFSIFIYFLYPLMIKYRNSTKFNLIDRIIIGFIISTFLLLGYVGQLSLDDITEVVGLDLSIIYFYFVLLYPTYNYVEKIYNK